MHARTNRTHRGKPAEMEQVEMKQQPEEGWSVFHLPSHWKSPSIVWSLLFLFYVCSAALPLRAQQKNNNKSHALASFFFFFSFFVVYLIWQRCGPPLIRVAVTTVWERAGKDECVWTSVCVLGCYQGCRLPATREVIRPFSKADFFPPVLLC